MNELALFRGKDTKFDDLITIKQPTLEQVVEELESGKECSFFDSISLFCATPTDMMVSLDDAGVDWNEITDWELFYGATVYGMTNDRTKLFTGDFKWDELEPAQDKDGHVDLIGIPKKVSGSGDKKITQICGITVPDDSDIYVFSEADYLRLVDVLRGIIGMKKNVKKAGNRKARKALLEVARRDEMVAKIKQANGETGNVLKNQISYLISTGIGYTYFNVWDLPIGVFMNIFARDAQINQSRLLLQSAYSGFGVDFKSLKEKDYDVYQNL